MTMRRVMAITLAIGACVAIGDALAAKGSSDVPLSLDVGKTEFAKQRQSIEAALGTERYMQITPEDRVALRQSLDRIEMKLADSPDGTLGRLPEPIRLDIFNEQSRANQVLARASDDSRIVCSRERATGSNFYKSTCLSVAERRRVREMSQEGIKQTMKQEAPWK